MLEDNMSSFVQGRLRKIPNYEELLCDVVNTCVKMYEDKYYLLSSEKHMLVKVREYNCHMRVGVYNPRENINVKAARTGS